MKPQQSGSTCALAVTLACLLAVVPPPAKADSSCPVSIPKAKLLGQEGPSSLQWFGSDSLAVRLPADGLWRGMGPQRDYFDKLFWLAGGFQPGMEDEFSITGHRLDDDESSLKPIVSGVTNADHEDFGGWAVLTGLGFPAKGCWEVTGSFRGQELTFVVQVVDTD